MILSVGKFFRLVAIFGGLMFMSGSVFADGMLYGTVRNFQYYDKAIRSLVQLYIVRVESNIDSIQINNISVNNGNCGLINQYYLPLSDKDKQANLKLGQYRDYILSPGCFPRQIVFDTDSGIEVMYFERK